MRNGLHELESPSSLINEVFEEPYRYSFFQIVRLLEGYAKKHPQKAKSINFSSALTLAFPASDNLSLKQTQLPKEPGVEIETAEEVWHLLVNFIGLYGPSGVLPVHYTELMMERQHYYKDDAMRAFFDLFNNRLIELFYEAWKQTKWLVRLEQGAKEAHFVQQILALIGRNFDGYIASQNDKMAQSYFSGMLTQEDCSKEKIKNVLSHQFDVNCEIEDFVGQYVEMPHGMRSTLGQSNNGLGTSMILGERYMVVQDKFCIHVGPLSAEKYRALLPSGKDYPAFKNWIQEMVGLQFDVDVCLILDPNEVTDFKISGGKSGLPLGQMTWFKQQQPLSTQQTSKRFSIV